MILGDFWFVVMVFGLIYDIILVNIVGLVISVSRGVPGILVGFSLILFRCLGVSFEYFPLSGLSLRVLVVLVCFEFEALCLGLV